MPRPEVEARKEKNLRISNYEGVSYRDDRLKKCIRLTALMLGITEEQLGALVESMHDQKGSLQIRWFHTPSGKAKMAVDDAWRECKENLTEHWWPGLAATERAGREFN